MTSEQGSFGHQWKNVLGKLATMENIATDRALTEDEATEKATLFLNPKGFVKDEEIYWRERSRSLWLKQWDKNIKFFHEWHSHKRYQLLVQGNVVQESESIQGVIVEFYQTLYSEDCQWRPGDNFINCPQLTGEEMEDLERSLMVMRFGEV